MKTAKLIGFAIETEWKRGDLIQDLVTRRYAPKVRRVRDKGLKEKLIETIYGNEEYLLLGYDAV
jgi:hypothetical protein